MAPRAAELLRRADFAMYTAKDRGRARVESYDDLAGADRAGPEPPAARHPTVNLR